MQNPKLEVHGHRGSRGTHPENTLAAFEEAFASGADAFELDTQWTADGVAIVFHDFEVSDRICRRDGKGPLRPFKVIDSTWKAIEEWDCGSVVQSKFPKQKLSLQKIPTLEATLAWLVKKPAPFYVNIEMKVAPEWGDAVVENYTGEVLRLVKQHGLEARCLLMSFDFRTVRTAKKLAPAIRSACLFEKAAKFSEVAKQNGATQIGPQFSLVTETVVREAHQAGLRVMPWTVNEPADWERLKKWGVDGLITDHPRELISYLGRTSRV